MDCDLPSYIEAQRFWEDGKVAPLVGTYLQRSVLIGVPLYLINGPTHRIREERAHRVNGCRGVCTLQN